jgi:hypothetical protein
VLARPHNALLPDSATPSVAASHLCEDLTPHSDFNAAEQRFDELDDVKCLDSALVRTMDQRNPAEVERADDRAPAVGVGSTAWGQAAW